MLWSLFLSLIIGGLLPLSFAPFDIYSLAFFVPAILLFLWMRSSPTQAFFIGLLFGIGFFGVGTSWIYISIHRFGNASVFLAGLITLLFVLILALFPATLGTIFRRFFQHKRNNVQCLLVFPALWVLWEWLRSHLLTGFPWVLLGYSQLNTPLQGLAPIIGVYGLSLCVALVSGALVLLSMKKTFFSHMAILLLIFGLFCLGYAFENHSWTKKTDSSLSISLIQGNIPQTVKWDSAYVMQNINVYKHLTFDHWSSQLIVWPEAAFPIAVQDAPDFIRLLGHLAKQHHSTIIFGAPVKNDQSQFYNAIVMIGESEGQYLKRHLVPFGEYTPLSTVFSKLMTNFNIPMSDFSAGEADQPLLQVNHTSIAAFICYEIAFSEEVLDTAKQSQLLLTVSDDSWFGRSIALAQHLQMAQMRSLETGRSMLLATNTGITAFISPFGKIIEGAPIDKRIVITQNITPRSGNTPLMRWYYYPLWSLIAVMLLAAILI